ncbi:MAG: hypothetical protein ACO1SV_21045 [Fimbriimonas sp.]
MSQRFEGIPESTKDAMTDAEVREVIARLSEERVAPKVGDVAAIAGASEDDVRRVLEELRAEQARKASAEAQRQVVADSAYRSPFMMGHATQPRPRILVAVILTLALLMAGLLMMVSVRATASAPPPPIEAPTTPAEGPQGESLVPQPTPPQLPSPGG